MESLKSGVFTSEDKWQIDPALCDGCGDCVVICPTKCLKIANKVAYMADVASCCRESCRMCELNCHTGAIRAYLGGVL